MKPGEELKDGPPIHGNTRLEIIWTAVPAILLVALCSYSYVALTDIEEAQAERAERPRRRRAVHLDLLLQGRDGEEFGSPQLYVPRDRPVHFTVQSMDVIHDFWVPGVPDEDRRRARASTPSCGSRRRRTASTRSSAPSCAASATPSCARPRTSSTRRSSTAGSRSAPRRPASGGGGGGGEEAGEGGGGAAPTARRSSRTTGCGGCHALADAGTNGGTGPDLDEDARRHATRRSSSRASSTRRPRSRRASRTG